MPDLEDRIRDELRQAGVPGDPSGVYERVLTRRVRRHIAHQAGIVALAVAVLAGSITGAWALSKSFRRSTTKPTPQPSTSPMPLAFRNGVLAYAVDESTGTFGGSDIYVVQPDGDHAQPLTQVGGAVDPTWSPDGRSLAFTMVQSASPYRSSIFVTGSDGVGIRALESGLIVSRSPAWSPDGTRIAFVGGPDVARLGIYLMNLDGSSLQRLSPPDLMVGQVGGHPTWSPNGREIAFAALGSAPGGTQIYVVDVRTGGVRHLPTGPASEYPSWSPDGRAIAFERGGVIFLASPTSGGSRQVAGFLAGTAFSPAWSPDGNELAFVSRNNAEGVLQVFTMHANGSGIQLITRGKLPANSPSWQPTVGSSELSAPSPSQTLRVTDGGHVLFVSNRDNHARYDALYSMRPDGSDVVRDGFFEQQGAISPDGTQVVVGVMTCEGCGRLDIMNIDGSNRRVLTSFTDPSDVAWSRDGKRIAFSDWLAHPPQSNSIFVIDPDGRNRIDVTKPPPTCTDGSPSWSPSGRQIVFVRDCSTDTERDTGLYVVNVDGTGLTRLTPQALQGGVPSWSPDGRELLFSGAFGDEQSQVFVMNPDGSGLRQLTSALAGENSGPVWSPRGRFIAFTSDRSGNKDVYVMNADGSDQTDISRNSFYDSAVSWQPR